MILFVAHNNSLKHYVLSPHYVFYIDTAVIYFNISILPSAKIWWFFHNISFYLYTAFLTRQEGNPTKDRHTHRQLPLKKIGVIHNLTFKMGNYSDLLLFCGLRSQQCCVSNSLN